MVKRGTLQYADFQVDGQMGSKAISVLIRAQEIISESGPYRYVEIGSYLGRTLQAHLNDGDCDHVLSIDLRPDLTPDERHELNDYKGITADDMVQRLAQFVPAENLSKLETATDSSDWLRDTGGEKYDLALIDGEHTITAAFRDFANLMEVMNDDCIIMFDDTSIILPAIRNAEAVLETQGLQYHTAHGRGSMTVLGIGRYAETVAREYTSDLSIRRGQADKRYRNRMIESNIREYVHDYLRNDEKLRIQVEATLNSLRQGAA